jgi:hypothetical protein
LIELRNNAKCRSTIGERREGANGTQTKFETKLTVTNVGMVNMMKCGGAGAIHCSRNKMNT